MAISYVEISDPTLIQSTLSKAREAGTPLRVIKGDAGKPAAFINDDNFRKFRKSVGKDSGAIGSKVFMSSKDIPTQRGANFDKPEAKEGPERQYKSKRVAQAKEAVGSAVDKTKSAIKKVPQLPGIAKVKTQDAIAKKFDEGVDKVINRVKNPPPKKPAPKPKPAGAKKPSSPKPGDPYPNKPIKNPKTTRSSSGRSVQVFDNLSQKQKAIKQAEKDLVNARRAELNVSNYKDKNPSPSRRMPLPPPSTKPMTGVESEKVPMPRAVKNRAVRGVDMAKIPQVPGQNPLPVPRNTGPARQFLGADTPQGRAIMDSGYGKSNMPTPRLRMSGMMGPLGFIGDFNSLVDESMRNQGIIDYTPVPPAQIPTGTSSPRFEYPDTIDQGGSMQMRYRPDMAPNPDYQGRMHYLLHGTDPVYDPSRQG